MNNLPWITFLTPQIWKSLWKLPKDVLYCALAVNSPAFFCPIYEPEVDCQTENSQAEASILKQRCSTRSPNPPVGCEISLAGSEKHLLKNERVEWKAAEFPAFTKSQQCFVKLSSEFTDKPLVGSVLLWKRLSYCGLRSSFWRPTAPKPWQKRWKEATCLRK